MNSIHRTLFAAAALLLAAPLLPAQASDSAFYAQMSKLRSLSSVERPIATIKLADEIRNLPAGKMKVQLANSLANLVTEGDQGDEAMKDVANTLAQALAEFPLPAQNDQPPSPYLELATLVRYKGLSITLNDPLFAKATQILIDNEADIQKADFTLKDLKNKKYTLSELKGKIVMVNFWATWCPPCRLELPDLDAIYTRLQSKGLVVLAITNEDASKVGSFLAKNGYHLPVLLDPGRKVAKQFHADGIPKSFIFNREGKLVAVAIDQTGERQFLAMLAKAGLHPE
jgi:peroxiredoxin